MAAEPEVLSLSALLGDVDLEKAKGPQPTLQAMTVNTRGISSNAAFSYQLVNTQSNVAINQGFQHLPWVGLFQDQKLLFPEKSFRKGMSHVDFLDMVSVWHIHVKARDHENGIEYTCSFPINAVAFEVKNHWCKCRKTALASAPGQLQPNVGKITLQKNKSTWSNHKIKGFLEQSAKTQTERVPEPRPPNEPGSYILIRVYLNIPSQGNYVVFPRESLPSAPTQEDVPSSFLSNSMTVEGGCIGGSIAGVSISYTRNQLLELLFHIAVCIRWPCPERVHTLVNMRGTKPRHKLERLVRRHKGVSPPSLADVAAAMGIHRPPSLGKEGTSMDAAALVRDLATADVEGLIALQERARDNVDVVDLINARAAIFTDNHLHMMFEVWYRRQMVTPPRDSAWLKWESARLDLLAHSLMQVEEMKKHFSWQWTLHFTVHCARELASRDITGKSDPYVKVKMSGSKWKSQVVKASLNPDWNESSELVFTSSGPHAALEEELKISVWDWDRMASNDLIGYCEMVDLGSLVGGMQYRGWLPCDHPTKDDNPNKETGKAGRVLVSLRLELTELTPRKDDLSDFEATAAKNLYSTAPLPRGGSRIVPDEGETAVVEAISNIKMQLTPDQSQSIRAQNREAVYELLCGFCEKDVNAKGKERLPREKWTWIKREMRARFGIPESAHKAAELRANLCVHDEYMYCDDWYSGRNHIEAGAFLEDIHSCVKDLQTLMSAAANPPPKVDMVEETEEDGDSDSSDDFHFTRPRQVLIRGITQAASLPMKLANVVASQRLSLIPGAKEGIKDEDPVPFKSLCMQLTSPVMPPPSKHVMDMWPELLEAVFKFLKSSLYVYNWLGVDEPSLDSAFKSLVQMLALCRDDLGIPVQQINEMVRVAVNDATKRALLNSYGLDPKTAASLDPATKSVLDINWVIQWVSAAQQLIVAHLDFFLPVVDSVFPELCFLRTMCETVWVIVRYHTNSFLTWNWPPRGMSLAVRSDFDTSSNNIRSGSWLHKISWVMSTSKTKTDHVQIATDDEITGNGLLLYPAMEVFQLRRELHELIFHHERSEYFSKQINVLSIRDTLDQFDPFVDLYMKHFNITMRRLCDKAVDTDKNDEPQGSTKVSGGYVDCFTGINQFFEYLKFCHLETNDIAAAAFAHNACIVTTEAAKRMMRLRNKPLAPAAPAPKASLKGSGNADAKTTKTWLGKMTVSSSEVASLESIGDQDGASVRYEAPLVSQHALTEAFKDAFGVDAEEQQQIAEQTAALHGFERDDDTDAPAVVLSSQLCVRLNNAYQMSVQLLKVLEDDFNLDVDKLLDALEEADLAASEAAEEKNDVGDSDDSSDDEDDEGAVGRTAAGRPITSRVSQKLQRTVTRKLESTRINRPPAISINENDRVQITKEGNQKGQLATVTDPHWNGLVKVRMASSGDIKSYRPEQLRVLEGGAPLTERTAWQVKRQNSGYSQLREERTGLAEDKQQMMLQAAIESQKEIRKALGQKLSEVAEVLVGEFNIDYMIEGMGREREPRLWPFFGTENVSGYMNEVMQATWTNMSSGVFDLFRSKFYDEFLHKVERTFSSPCDTEDKYLCRSRLLLLVEDFTSFLYADAQNRTMLDRRLARKKVKINQMTMAVPVSTSEIIAQYNKVQSGDAAGDAELVSVEKWRGLAEEDLIRILDGRDYDEEAVNFVDEQEATNKEVTVAQKFREIDVNENVLLDTPCKNKNHSSGTMYLTENYLLFAKDHATSSTSRHIVRLATLARVQLYDHWRYHGRSRSIRTFDLHNDKITLHGFADAHAVALRIVEQARTSCDNNHNILLQDASGTTISASTGAMHTPHPPNSPPPASMPEGVSPLDLVEDYSPLSRNQTLKKFFHIGDDEDLLDTRLGILHDPSGAKFSGTAYTFTRHFAFLPNKGKDSHSQVLPFEDIKAVARKKTRLVRSSTIVLHTGKGEMNISMKDHHSAKFLCSLLEKKMHGLITHRNLDKPT